MTLKTSLIISGDGTGGVKAANDVDRAMAGAADEAQALARAYTVADDAIADLAKAQALANGEIRDAKSELKTGVVGLEEYNRKVLETKSALSLVSAEHRDAMKALRKADEAYVSALHAANDFDDRLTAVTRTTNAAAFAQRNLTYQLVDTAQGLALGAPPLMVLMQQLPQAADAFAMLAAESGGAGAAIGGLVSKFGPAALAVGAIAGGVMLLTAEINKNSDVTVTWKDVVFGTFEGISAAITSTLLAGWGKVSPYVGAVWDRVVQIHKGAVNFVIGAIVAIPRAIVDTYDKIPAAYGDAFYSAANLAIEALNWLVQKSAVPINLIIDGLNSAFGTRIPKVVLGGIDKIANPYAGAMGALGKAGAASLVKSFSTDYYQGALDTIGGWARNHAIKSAADKAGKEVGAKAGKAAGAAMAEDHAKTYADLLAEKLAQYEGKIREALKGIIKAGETPLSIDFVDPAKVLEAERKAQERIDAEHRARALDTAYDIADIIGGGVGNAIKDLADALDKGFPNFVKDIGKALGVNGSALFSQLSAGAQIGSSIDGIMGAIGIKSSNTGAQLGGMAGSFAGPIGTIAGSIVGGIIGGLFKKTPKASATVSIIAGDVMDTVVSGNKGKLKEIASGMANSLIGSLSQMADSLDAELGNASVSVGMRKKNYVVDPTGQGRTKGSGVINFGQDEAAAMKFAVQDAIRDGVLAGLPEGFQTYLSSGDVEKRLQDVLALKGALDERQSVLDPQGYALGQLDKDFAKLRSIAQATGEGMAEIEELYGIKRTDILDKFAQEALDKERRAQEQRVEILTLEGKADEAKALSRQLEMQGLTDLERVQQERIYALREEADAAAQAQAIADEAYAIETRRLQVLGDTVALQERELDTVNAANRARLSEVFALEKAIAAQEEAARTAEAIAQERDRIETELLTLQGDQAALTERQLAALYPANRALQENVNALKAQAEAAATASAIAQERYNLETRLLQSLGDTNALRRRERDAVNEANRDVLDRIYAVEDAKAERDTLIQSYQREQSALAATAEKMRGFAQTIREFRDGLVLGTAGAGASAALTRAQYQQTASLAALGNEASLSSFTTSAQAYLDVSRKGSWEDYQDAIAIVARDAGAAIKGAEGLASAAGAQSAWLEQQSISLANIETAGADLNAALERLNDLQSDELLPVLTDQIGDSLDDLNGLQRDLLSEIKALRAEAKAERDEAKRDRAEFLAAFRLIRRNSALAVVTDDDRPIAARVSGEVKVTNPADKPVFVDQVP